MYLSDEHSFSFSSPPLEDLLTYEGKKARCNGMAAFTPVYKSPAQCHIFLLHFTHLYDLTKTTCVFFYLRSCTLRAGLK